MRASYFIFIASLMWFSACSAPTGGAPEGPTVVVVFSDAGQEVAPPVGLFASYELGEGQGATLLDAKTLAKLPTHRLDADLPLGTAIRSFEGPLLADVLAASGASGLSARLTAIDGYQVDISADMIARYDPILATQVNGTPLAIGGLGPTILIWPRQSDSSLRDMNDDLWPWSVFAIEALSKDDN